MLDPLHLLVASATVECGICALVAALAVVLGVRAVRRAVPAARVPLQLGVSAVGSFDMAEVWTAERAAMEPEGLEYETADGGRRAHVVDLWGAAQA
jgi:hypothetical protein